MRRMKCVLLCMLAAVVLLSSGCKPSPVLEEVVYLQNVEEVDKDNDTKVNDNDEDHTNQDEKLPEKEQIDDSDTERDREKDKPVEGENENDAKAPDTEYDKDSENNNASGETSSEDPSKGENNTQGTGEEEEQGGGGTGGAGEEGESQGPTNDVTMRQIVDASGKLVDVPENVDRVSAVGEAAVMVQMLGGEGRLVASSKSFTSNSMAKSVFGDEGIEQVAALWSGQGNTKLSDSKFQELLAKKPQVCFVISGQSTFSESQAATLKENKIGYVALPKLNTSDNIKLAVQIIGEVLGDKSASGGLNAPELASRFASYYDSIVSDIGGKVARFARNGIDYDNDKVANGVKYLSGYSNTNGKYTIFISDWEDDTYYKVYYKSTITMDGHGVAIVNGGYSYNPLAYHLSMAGVVNTGTIFRSYANKQERFYASPLEPSTRLLEYSGGDGIYLERGNNLAKVDGEAIYLGDGNFPAVIVASQYIKNKVENDQMWKNYGVVTAESEHVSGYGFLDETGSIVSSYVHGDYEIYVNPKGVGSWTEGSAESMLEPLWVAWKFYGAYSQSEVEQKVKDFYKTFYRHDLTSSQLNTILSGPSK